MADENSQDYERYARTVKDELYETPQNPKKEDTDNSQSGNSDDTDNAGPW